MIIREIGIVKIKHDKCYNEIMQDIKTIHEVRIGYRCKTCGLFIHKESNTFKNKEEKL